MEMQLKHFKLSYDNINDALDHTDGLGIISFLFEADDDSHHFEPLEVFFFIIIYKTFKGVKNGPKKVSHFD